ncbi:FadR family transcriptional regulator [Kribbella sandramycini]|uniref:FadR family transcriptional regulator n=1 Tax=Kribbella sandramycini TaxID=60450 RepID=A0A7Y4NZD2_9ACTN|nr:FCD domain-containing protein [Kribbella sandramycini]MBB6565212.1 DNA-binding FadR family transcriptional regulator [Kribbella sandramycini]NOL41481.1 FadR family transcriptional regulator [Kribbella sandramycini]
MAATDTALAGLRQMIASGALGPGAKFPPEPELCERLGVSRSSLREAVRSLAALGVIESRHGSGTYVSALDPAEIISRFSLSVQLIPLEGVLQLLEVRRVLEAHATAAAAARQDPDLAPLLDKILEQLEATTDAAEIQRLDAEFHDAICAAGGNPTVTALTAVIRGRGGHYRIFEPGSEFDAIKQTSDRGHRAILAAIAHRDPAAAATAASAHIAQTELWLRALRPEPQPD